LLPKTGHFTCYEQLRYQLLRYKFFAVDPQDALNRFPRHFNVCRASLI